MAQPSSAELKLIRAEEFITQLNAEITSFLAETPYELLIRDDRKAQERTLIIKTHKTVPHKIGLILGDALHNIRSSLDHAIFEVVSPKTALHDKIQFPFSANKESLKSVIHNRLVNLAGEKIVAKIYSFRSYKENGDILLYAVHTMDIADKHKLIIPTTSIAVVDIDAIKADFPMSIFPVINGTFIFKDLIGENMIRADLPPEEYTWFMQMGRVSRRMFIREHGRYAERKPQFPFTIDLAFPKAHPVNPTEVIPALVGMVKTARGIIQSLSE